MHPESIVCNNRRNPRIGFRESPGNPSFLGLENHGFLWNLQLVALALLAKGAIDATLRQHVFFLILLSMSFPNPDTPWDWHIYLHWGGFTLK